MANLTLFATKREVLGKKNKFLREQGLIPAILYGANKISQALQVDLKEFEKVLKQAGETDIIELVIDDKDKRNVLVQDVARDFITNKIIHVDLYEVEMNKPIVVTVPLTFEGESPAVKEGGILVKSMDEIEIEALPRDIPHTIPIDISSLQNIGQTIYVGDLKVSDKVKILVDPKTPIVSITNPITEEELEAELGRVKTVEEVEVVAEAKQEENLEAKEATKTESTND